MDPISKALNISLKAHFAQADKGGNSYILHPIWVALHCETEDEKVLALLHDVIEDSEITKKDIIDEGFPDHIIEALDCITRENDETYLEYINRVSKNPLATKVKMLDLRHNMDLSGISSPNSIDIERQKRYDWYLQYLEQNCRRRDHEIN